MPSLLMSVMVSSVGSTFAQVATHAGRFANDEPDHVVIDVVLRQHRQRGRGEVQQEDEEQRPEHRDARLLHRRRRVVAHQDVRQRSRAEHHAEHDAEEVARLRCRAPSRLPRRPCWSDRASRAAAADRTWPCCARPASSRRPWRRRRLREVVDRLLRRADLGDRGVGRLQVLDLLGGRGLARLPSDAGSASMRALASAALLLEDLAHLQLLRIVVSSFSLAVTFCSTWP